MILKFYQTILCIFLITTPVLANDTATAVFAGGCFWCIESDFEKLGGVLETVSGYTGGSKENATYSKVSNGGTKHYEAVEVTYLPEKVSYKELVEYFFRHIDPFNDHGQFCDSGSQYRAAVFYGSEEEKMQAEEVQKRLEKALGKEMVTKILPAGPFYKAEEYHQDYYKKNPAHYSSYRTGCGRDRRVYAVWDGVSLSK